MKKYTRFGFMILLLAFLSCNNNVQSGDTSQKKEKISITSVTLEGKNCEKNSIVEVPSETSRASGELCRYLRESKCKIRE